MFLSITDNLEDAKIYLLFYQNVYVREEYNGLCYAACSFHYVIFVQARPLQNTINHLYHGNVAVYNFWIALSTITFGIYARLKGLPRELTKQYFTCSNIIAAVAGLALAGMLIHDLVQASKDPVFHNFRESGHKPMILAAIAACTPLLCKEFRGLWSTGLIMSFVLCMCAFAAPLFLFITSYQLDYLPSNWSYTRRPVSAIG